MAIVAIIARELDCNNCKQKISMPPNPTQQYSCDSNFEHFSSFFTVAKEKMMSDPSQLL